MKTYNLLQLEFLEEIPFPFTKKKVAVGARVDIVESVRKYGMTIIFSSKGSYGYVLLGKLVYPFKFTQDIEVIQL